MRMNYMGDSFQQAADGDRTFPECGRDCEPESFVTDEGLIVAFVCPLDGVHSVINPFATES